MQRMPIWLFCIRVLQKSVIFFTEFLNLSRPKFKNCLLRSLIRGVFNPCNPSKILSNPYENLLPAPLGATSLRVLLWCPRILQRNRESFWVWKCKKGICWIIYNSDIFIWGFELIEHKAQICHIIRVKNDPLNLLYH